MVKLTDSALRSIEEFIRNKVSVFIFLLESNLETGDVGAPALERRRHVMANLRHCKTKHRFTRLMAI